ncbi:MAG: phosphate acyltransferase [Verrucomicrobiota bacterium]
MPKEFSFSEPDPFTQRLFDKLQRHPKRIVFTEGHDLRVLRVAREMVRREIAVPILIGNRGKIQEFAAREDISMEFINVINPERSEDLELFCRRFEKMERYRQMKVTDARRIMTNPHYFAAMMVQYGQADGLIGGNQSFPAAIMRALLHIMKPLPDCPRIAGCTVLAGLGLPHFGEDNVLFLADTGVIPEPNSNELAMIAVEAGKLFRHHQGRPARVAMLSFSTKGSAHTLGTETVRAATAIAKERIRSQHLEMEIDGEMQVDVALIPEAAERKTVRGPVAGKADVLVFPNLDSGHMAFKLLHHIGGARSYGQIILGLARPAAQVSRAATEESILGTAAAVGVEAVKYHELYLDDFLSDA